MCCNNWFRTSDLFTSWCFVTPSSSVQTSSLFNTLQSMRIDARILHFGANVCGVLQIFKCSVGDWLNWTTIDIFTNWRLATPFTRFHALQRRFATQLMASITVILNCRMNVVIVTNDIRTGRQIWCFTSNYFGDYRECKMKLVNAD